MPRCVGHRQRESRNLRTGWCVALLLLLNLTGCASGRQGSLPRADRQDAIAFLPLQNLTGELAPIREIGETLQRQMTARGVRLLEDSQLRQVMQRHRMRYTGGLSKEMGRAFFQEANVAAVMLTSLDEYDEIYPPRISLTARLVSTGENQRILWMESVTLAGDEQPGILGMKLVTDPRVMLARATAALADSFARNGTATQHAGPSKRRFPPRSVYRASQSTFEAGTAQRVAVLSFANQSTRKEAGELVALQLIRQLSRTTAVSVVEPGLVREALLETRTIQQGGLSLAQIDLLRAFLDVDLVLIGTVIEYQDASGTPGGPVVAFSVQAVDTEARQVVWSSRSRRFGDEKVVFFDAGRVHTAQGLSSGLAGAVIDRMLAQATSKVPAVAKAR